MKYGHSVGSKNIYVFFILFKMCLLTASLIPFMHGHCTVIAVICHSGTSTEQEFYFCGNIRSQQRIILTL